MPGCALGESPGRLAGLHRFSLRSRARRPRRSRFHSLLARRPRAGQLQLRHELLAGVLGFLEGWAFRIRTAPRVPVDLDLDPLAAHARVHFDAVFAHAPRELLHRFFAFDLLLRAEIDLPRLRLVLLAGGLRRVHLFLAHRPLRTELDRLPAAGRRADLSFDTVFAQAASEVRDLRRALLFAFLF